MITTISQFLMDDQLHLKNYTIKQGNLQYCDWKSVTFFCNTP